MHPFNGYFQPLNHGDIGKPSYLIGIANGHTADPIGKKPFHRHGAGQGIRIGIDHNKDLIVTVKDIIKAVQPTLGRIFTCAPGNGISYFFQSFLHCHISIKKDHCSIMFNVAVVCLDQQRLSVLSDRLFCCSPLPAGRWEYIVARNVFMADTPLTYPPAPVFRR